MERQESRLLRELKQTRPFQSIHQEATLSVMKTADVLRRQITRRLEPHEITPQQYNVLRILRGAGDAGLPTLSIGERLIEETPGMTRLLDRLEFKGLIRRVRCEQDRRQVLCYIAEGGSALLATLDPIMAASQMEMSGTLSAAEAECLVLLLEKMRERINQ